MGYSQESSPILDQSQILLALTHLLHHAIDTSLPNNSIYLRAASRNGGGVQLKIDHAAAKIPATELSSLFEPFYRVGRPAVV